MKKKYIIPILIMAFCFLLFWIPSVKAADDEGNLVIVLDPGHGGYDPGASNSAMGIKEADVNYKLAIYAKEELEKYEGVKVYLTRYADCPSIYDRGEFAKNYQADLVVSLHINAGASSARGAEIWVTQDKTKVEFYEKSKEVGEKILNKISQLGIKNNGVSTRSGQPNEWYESGVVKDYYGIIRYPMNYNIRSLLVEHCYISNNNDCQFINSDEKIRKLAIADAQGIVEAYKLNKKGEGKQPVRFFSINQSELNLEITPNNPEPVGNLYAKILPTNAYNQEIDWYSSNPEVVRAWGSRLRGLKEGEVTITAITKNNQRIAKCKVKVTKPEIPLESISTDRETIVLDINQRDEISVKITPDNASDKTLYWESSEPEVVRVWDGGIRGLKEGTSIITATSRASGKTLSCKVVVKDSNKKYVEDIKFEKTEYEARENEAVDIPFTYTPEDAINAEFEWTSSNPEVLRVWGNRFRALKKGTAEVIVRTTDGTVEKRIKVTVKEGRKVTDIQLEKTEYKVKIDDAFDIQFTYNPEDAINAEFEWTSSNPEVLRVWGNRFRALKEGTAEVIVRTTDRSIEKRIKVIVKNPNKIYVEDIQLEKLQYEVKENEAVDIPFTYTPKDAINAEFEWTSSDPEVLRVWGNRFRALKKGTAEVIVRTKDGTAEKRVKVTVKEGPKVIDINLEKLQYAVNINEAVDIPFTYTPEDATNAEFEWSSSNDEILRVWGNRFRALKKGTAEVIVRTVDGTVEKRIKVNVEGE